MDVPPSPKSQSQLVILPPVDRSVKFTRRGITPVVVSASNSAVSTFKVPDTSTSSMQTPYPYMALPSKPIW